MFGYVTPYRGELKVKEYEIFKAYYCGLCKSLGKEFNQATRFGLNYDLNFLGILLSSLDDEKKMIKYEGCIANPFKKKKIIESNRSIKYTTHMSIILVYFKLLDDWKDEKSIKSLIASIPYLFSVRKAKKSYKDKFCYIKECLYKLSDLENKKCPVIDESADAFGKLMEEIAVPEYIKEEGTIRTLKWLGYNLGRWIYIIDAFNDLEEDVRNKTYNPILLQYQYHKEEDMQKFVNRIRDKIEFPLVLTLDNIAKSFEILDIRYNRSILENILYMGTRHKMEKIFNKWEAKNEKSI